MDNINFQMLNVTSQVTSVNSDSFGIDKQVQAAVQAVYTSTTPSAKVFASSAVDTTAETVTLTAHGLTTGLVGQLTTDGALPTGLATSTNYYIIVVDANTFAFATSYANAIAGTKINLTAQGSGNDTFTPTVLAGSLQFQVSNDNTNWTNKGSAISISASGSTMQEFTDAGYTKIRAAYTHTSGQLSLSLLGSAKG